MRIVFMGTPEFGVPALACLCEAGFTPQVVYSQPDRPSGRGLRTSAPAVAVEARRRDLPLRQPEHLQRPEELEFLEALKPDVIVTAAYGKIFRERLLGLPRRGCFNLHPSLLPLYRGLSPVQRAILRGDAVTGVTLYRMVRAVDAGPILAQRQVPVGACETAGELTQRLAEVGAGLLVEALPALDAGQLQEVAQDEALASYAPRLGRGDGRLDWRLPAGQIERVVRGLTPWPGAFTYCSFTRVKVLQVEAIDETPRRVPPGTVLRIGKKGPPLVAALPGAVAVVRVQAESCQAQGGDAFCCGRRLREGDRLLPHPPSI
ncbi:MAG: methionyl-tRNA formyltransferase [Candidatus Eisenbacteria bacterium]